MNYSVSEDPFVRIPWDQGKKTIGGITQVVCQSVETPILKTPAWWWFGFVFSLTLLGILGGTIGYLMWQGIGVWGNNTPVAWGWDIVNFVWWIGIAHAGTAISAVLFLFRQHWRTSISRFAEAMTLFAVLCALVYPAVHVGRMWVAYYMFPLPNQMGLWPNFSSPLLWDFAAVSTYGLVSALFWYIGLLPDFATLRDRARNKTREFIYGTLALGWRGSQRHWQNYDRAYLILAAIATPLVLSVHSIVSFDFATSNLPGWHTTIFPPYFVAGAVFSGFAMLSVLMILARKMFGYTELVTKEQIENIGKIMLTTSLMLGYCYSMEIFTAWYSANSAEKFAFWNRLFGHFGWAFWIMFICNAVIPQLFWFEKIRSSIGFIFAISLLINVGMWFERFVIVITLHSDFLPSSLGHYQPSVVDILTYLGTFGLFFTLFLLFLRFLPQLSMSEIKAIQYQEFLKKKSHLLKSSSANFFSIQKKLSIPLHGRIV